MTRMTLHPPKPPRSPWQFLYGAAHRARRRWFRQRAQRLRRPVISIGNLHWGGGGKTPLTAAVAAHLRDRGAQVAILTRGYKSRGHGVRVVSRGEGPLLGPSVAGDEPVLLAGKLPGVAVVVSPDRYSAGVHALERLSPAPDVFLLDDGFSHVRLHREIDLLAFPIADVFGGGRLPPSGRLREPLASVAHADAVLLTGPGVSEGAELAKTLVPFGFEGPGFSSPTAVLPALDVNEVEIPRRVSILLVTGVARPAAVAASAKSLGYEIADTVTFPDHHDYSRDSIDLIVRRFDASDATTVVTTEKDWVKLLGRIDRPLGRIPVEARPEASFWSWLDRRFDALGMDGSSKGTASVPSADSVEENR